jgi:hypothetical protein
MAGHPADFDEWLSGECVASNPPGWRVECSPTEVAVRPRQWKTIAVMSAAALSFAGVGIFFIGHGVHEGGFASIGVVAGIGLFLGAGLMSFGAIDIVRDQRAGPYLTYAVRDGTISLPRERLTFPATDAREWRVVTGNWAGPPGRQKQQNDAHSELHLLVRTPDGVTAYPVVGWTSTPAAGPLPADMVRELAVATRLPLRFVEQHQGVTRQDTLKELTDW